MITLSSNFIYFCTQLNAKVCLCLLQKNKIPSKLMTAVKLNFPDSSLIMLINMFINMRKRAVKCGRIKTPMLILLSVRYA